ncbi:MAG: glutathione peroxidase [Paenibacillus macerans]|uniref:Glutathione peroxidase n=1 Tax=Paenibacillus macerans TaxID=44252 RepID=A0A090ZNU9_PAEMA|nr:glutathione peroxidase [Paenibacillus macerans]KFN05851.1 glutathione peroxidase family protein [Paenibacillus macerans]MBS5910188.1 glutathione peroxidase [Paenibacillus macerans]MCY7559789.1 glutathione peroxidase [Paenibacillus macerans]MDU5950746.1 glutathione peroxidase [Paenibacillus macerans]MDU7475267.1 glutathione peroxidase [Paenibacillus macerans]
MSVYDFQAALIDGTLIDLSAYRGKILLIVNLASKCSFSRQFAGLQKLYETWRDQGFEILGFPCNQFNGKEPGNNGEVRETCRREFGVTFPLFEKIDVRGEAAHPLFQYLTEQAPFQGFAPDSADGRWMSDFLQQKYPDIYAGNGVKWNFSKFLIGRDGQVLQRFEPTVQPEDIHPFLERLIG